MCESVGAKVCTIQMKTRQTWNFNVQRDDWDTDWPDSRRKPWGSKTEYRPIRVELTYKSWDGKPPALYSLSIYGPRVVKAGPVGAIVSENLWGKADEPWLAALVTRTTALIPQPQTA